MSISNSTPLVCGAIVLVVLLCPFSLAHAALIVDGIFTGNGGPLNDLYDSRGPLNVFNAPAINNSGVVAFLASEVIQGIFTGNGGPLTTIADSTGPFGAFGNDVSINASGRVAFFAASLNGRSGIFTGTGGPLTTIVDNSGALHGGGQLSINNVGEVVFIGDEVVGSSFLRGIFTGPNPVTDKVIAVGDPLDGSTVSVFASSFFLSNHALNNSGQIAFFAYLADGRTGVFRADPSGGGSYTFTTIADSSSLPFDVLSPSLATINANGTVAFHVANNSAGFFGTSLAAAVHSRPLSKTFIH